MANDLNIESLSIEFQVTSASAMDAVDRLEEKLKKLKAATQGGLQGASSVAKSLEKLAQAAKGFDSVDTGKLTATAEVLNKLGSIAASGNLSGVAAQMKDLSKIGNTIANMPSISTGQLQTLTGLGSALSSLSNIPQLPDLSGTASQMRNLTRIANTVTGVPSVSIGQRMSLSRLVGSLQSLSNIPQLPDLSSTARSLTQLNGVAASITAVDMSAAALKIQELTSAVKPLETLGKTNLSSFINSLKKLPEVSTALSSMDMGAFAAQIQTVASALSPLTTQLTSMANAVSALPQPIQNAVAGLMNFNNAAQNAGNSTNSLLSKIKNLLSIGSIIAISRRIKSLFGGMIESSNMFVENMNLFAVSMGNAADEALNFANRVNELMGIDVSQWIENQGYFKQIASGFGVVEEKANLMSQNLTQLGFDISSFYNISVEAAMQKLQSGISGEIMPLRRLGYALDESTLKQVAFNHGITDSIQNMTQAQKSQIRYIAIMEQSKNALGDMARTLESPANQMRIFSQRVDQLKRAIGNGLMPITSAALPWVTAFVKLLTEGAQKIADFLGFEIPKFDYGDLIADSNKGISSSFDDATKAVKEFKGTLSGIDQLNIIGSEKDTSGTGLGDMYDLNIDLPSYDFLGGLEESTDKAYNTIKEFMQNVKNTLDSSLIWQFFKGIGGFVGEMAKNIDSALPIIESLGAAFLTFGVISGIQSAITAFKALSTSMSPLAFTITTAVGAFVLFKTTVKNLTVGTKNLIGNITGLVTGIAAVGTAIAGLAVSGHPVMALAVGLSAVAGAIKGVQDANAEITAQKIADAFNSGKTPIDEFANALEDVSIKLSSSETDYLNVKNDLSGISTNAETVGTQLHTMITELQNTGVLAETEIGKMKTAFGELAAASEDYITKSNTNFKNYILANSSLLEKSGINVGGLVDVINESTSNSIDKIQQLQAEADKLTEKMKGGTQLDTTEMLRLEEINMKLLEYSGVKVDFGVDFSETKSVLDSISSLKFKDAETAAENINKAFDTAADAYAKLNDTKLSIMAQVEGLDIDESEKRKVREAMETLFDVKRLQLDEAIVPALDKIMTNAGSLVSKFTTAAAQETAANSWLGLFSSENRANMFQNKSIEEINEEKVKNQLGSAAGILMNPMEALYAEFAQRGIGLDFVDSMFESGRNGAKGYANGISENSKLGVDATAKMATDSLTALDEVLDEHSPSKETFARGAYFDEGLLLGIKSKERDVLNEVAAFSERLNSALMIAPLDWSVLMGETPEMDFSKVYTPSSRNSYYMRSSEPTQTAGYDVASVMEIAQLVYAAQDGNPTEFTIYTNVELDGEAVGAAVTRSQDYQMRMSNGR